MSLVSFEFRIFESPLLYWYFNLNPFNQNVPIKLGKQHLNQINTLFKNYHPHKNFFNSNTIKNHTVIPTGNGSNMLEEIFARRVTFARK